MATTTTPMTVTHKPGPVTDPCTDMSADELARALCAAAVIADPESAKQAVHDELHMDLWQRVTADDTMSISHIINRSLYLVF